MDRLVDPNGCFDLIEKSAEKKKGLFYYPNGRHNLLRGYLWEGLLNNIIRLVPRFLKKTDQRLCPKEHMCILTDQIEKDVDEKGLEKDGEFLC